MHDDADDNRYTPFVLGCLFTCLATWQFLDAWDDDGLALREWITAVVLGLILGASFARLGYLGMRWIDRRWFGGKDD